MQRRLERGHRRARGDDAVRQRRREGWGQLNVFGMRETEPMPFGNSRESLWDCRFERPLAGQIRRSKAESLSVLGIGFQISDFRFQICDVERRHKPVCVRKGYSGARHDFHCSSVITGRSGSPNTWPQSFGVPRFSIAWSRSSVIFLPTLQPKARSSAFLG